jgi:hypothetical protein
MIKLLKRVKNKRLLSITKLQKKLKKLLKKLWQKIIIINLQKVNGIQKK